MTNDQPDDSSEDGGSQLARPNSVSYIQIPAEDTFAEATFYERVFGWRTSGSAAHMSFQDSSGLVAGAFVTGRAISREPGILPYVYVSRIDETLAAVRKHGGEIVRDPYPEGDLWVATVRDPAGNVIGVWQMGPR